MLIGDLDFSFEASAGAGAAPSPGGSGPPPVTTSATLTPSAGSPGAAPALTLSRSQIYKKMAGSGGVLRGEALSVDPMKFASRVYDEPSASPFAEPRNGPRNGMAGKIIAGLLGVGVVAGIVYWLKGKR